jgi:hypothetical protein
MTDDPKPIPAIEQASENLDGLIERWWADHFPGSAVARDTAAWNVAHAAKEALKRLLGSAQRSPAVSANKDLQRSIR